MNLKSKPHSQLFLTSIYETVPNGPVTPNQPRPVQTQERLRPLYRLLHTLSLMQRTDVDDGSNTFRIPLPHQEVSYVKESLAEDGGDDDDGTQMALAHQSRELALAFTTPILVADLRLQPFCTYDRVYSLVDTTDSNKREMRAWCDLKLDESPRHSEVVGLLTEVQTLREEVTGAIEAHCANYASLMQGDTGADEDDVVETSGEVVASVLASVLQDVRDVVADHTPTTQLNAPGLGAKLGSHVRPLSAILPQGCIDKLSAPCPQRQHTQPLLMHTPVPFPTTTAAAQMNPSWVLMLLGKFQDFNSGRTKNRSVTQSQVDANYEQILRFMGWRLGYEYVSIGFMFTLDHDLEVRVYKLARLTEERNPYSATVMDDVKWVVELRCISLESDITEVDKRLLTLYNLISDVME